MTTHSDFFLSLVNAHSGTDTQKAASTEALVVHVFGTDYGKKKDSAYVNMFEAVTFVAERGHGVFAMMNNLLQDGQNPKETSKNYARTVQDIHFAYQAMMWVQAR